LPEPELVQKPTCPSPRLTTHTGVDTGFPSRRNVVNSMYFSSANAIV
jgi:hypothetical protein